MTNSVKRIIAGCVAAALCVSCGVWIAVEISSGSDFNFTGGDLSLKQNQVLFDRTDASGNKNGEENDDSYIERKDSDSDVDSSDKGNSGFVFKETTVVNPGSNTDKPVDKTDTDSQTPGENDNVYDIIDDPNKADDVINGNITPSKPDTPSDGGTVTDGDLNKNYSSSAKDPDGSKTYPDGFFVPSDNFNENIVPAKPDEDDGSNTSVVIQKPPFDGKTYLYYGQTVTDLIVYNALETYVQGADNRQYIWDADDYGVYIKIDAVSFDGGKTWISSFPVNIPLSASDGTMKIKASYRLSKKSKWISTEVSYALEEMRVLILSERLKAENQTITSDMLLNQDLYLQHVKINEKINLLRYQYDLLGDGRLTSLFPGFTENGKLLPWFYYPTAGRHILEPADRVSLSAEYNVSITCRWMSDDFEEGFQYNNLCYLQTLIGYTGNTSTLSVPMYVQAVDFADFQTVDTLKIPETVLFVNTADGLLSVENAYSVDENNPVYCSVQGVLLNKGRTKILGVPQNISELVVPEKITDVSISKINNLQRIIIQTNDVAKIPEIDFKNIKSSCTIVVSDDIWLDFMTAYRRNIEDYGLYVSAASSPDKGYTVKSGMIVSRENSLHDILSVSGDTLTLPDAVSSIENGVLQNYTDITKIILPKNGQVVSFEKGSLENTGVTSIFCYSEEQYAAAREAADETIEVMLLAVSKEGYVYYIEEGFWEERRVLVSVPSDTVEFDGKVTDQNGYDVYITEIQEAAFAENTVLKWVTLPETVSVIGKNAFSGCSSLEGVLIDAQFSVSIGDGAFDGCYSLRFVASNAFLGTLEDGYDFAVTDGYYSSALYAPTGCWGYSANWISFTEESDIVRYTLLDIGENSKALYGVSADGSAKILLRSGKTLDKSFALPESTVEIWMFAFADAYSDERYFTVDWSNIQMIALNTGAFENSGISGSVVLPDIFYMGSDLFTFCDGITDVTFGYIYPGVDIYSGIFTGCDNLEKITLINYDPPGAVVNTGSPFQFDYFRSYDDEADTIELCVPEFCEQSYVKKWRYLAAGYYYTYTETAYQVMWTELRYKYSDFDTSYFPSDDEVDALLESHLLEAENRLRRMMRLEEVSYPTELYHFRVSSDGYITLTKAPPDITAAFIYDEDLGLLDGWSVDYIAAGAFSRCKNLEYVALPDNLVGIYEGAFEGIESESLLLVCWPDNPPELLGFTEGKPFDFGIPDEHIKFIAWGKLDDYEEAWLYPLAGYSNEAEVRRLLPEELAEELGRDPTEEEIDKAIEDRILAAKKRFSLLFDSDEDTDGEV